MFAPSNPVARFAKFATAFIAGPLRRHDAALIFGLAAIAVVWLKHIEAAGRLLAFAVARGRVALGAAAYRRNLRLQGENLGRQAAEQDSGTLARHDTLTGLPNRRYFTEMVA